MSLEVGCLIYAVEKQPQKPRINPGKDDDDDEIDNLFELVFVV